MNTTIFLIIILLVIAFLLWVRLAKRSNKPPSNPVIGYYDQNGFYSIKQSARFSNYKGESK